MQIQTGKKYWTKNKTMGYVLIHAYNLWVDKFSGTMFNTDGDSKEYSDFWNSRGESNYFNELYDLEMEYEDSTYSSYDDFNPNKEPPCYCKLVEVWDDWGSGHEPYCQYIKWKRKKDELKKGNKNG